MAKYIYEQDNWPAFSWDAKALTDKLGAVHHLQEHLLNQMNALGFRLREEASLQSLTEEIITSSAIEGESLDKEAVRSSLARRLDMDIGALASPDRNVDGIVEMTLDATRSYTEPLTAERLFGWHAALFPTGRSGMFKIKTGQWRDGSNGPMQVVSGKHVGKPVQIHFEAPPADQIETEMTRFLNWFNVYDGTDLIVRAGLAHLWFVTIHPFEDGNGRIARAITDMALARSEKMSLRFYSMSAQIRDERSDYYDQLERTQKDDLDITEWLDWFLGCLGRAFTGAEKLLNNTLTITRFWNLHRASKINERQRAVLNRILNGFEGKLTSSKWAKIGKCSQDTASRDITEMMQQHILVKEAAGGRSTSYKLVTKSSDALEVIADYVRVYAHRFEVNKDRILEGEERASRLAEIKAIADQIDQLAHAGKGYLELEPLMHKLHTLGFFLDENHLSALAFVGLFERSAKE